jgi:hypothetical protein
MYYYYNALAKLFRQNLVRLEMMLVSGAITGICCTIASPRSFERFLII